MAKSARSLGTVGIVSACAFAQLLLQFVLQVVLARYFGAGPQMDAYLAAFAVPVVLTAVFVGSLSYAFVPVFIERVRNAGDDAWEMATVVGASVAGLSLAIALAGYAFATPLVSRLYPGFSPPQGVLTAGLFRVVIWLLVTNSLVSFLFSLYHGLQRFLLPALSSVIGTALTVGLTVYWQRSLGIYAVAWAVLCGSILQAGVLVPLWIAKFRFRGRIDPGTRRCLVLLLPLIAGAAYYKLDPLVDRYLASQLPPGSISHLGYAWRIATALITIGTTGLSTVAFPALSTHSAGGRMDAFRDEIAHCWRLLAFLMIPIGVGLAFFSRPAVADLLERGAFTPADTAAVAWLLLLYIGAIVAASVGEVAAKVFFALNNTRTPAVILAISFTLGLVLKFALAPVLETAGLAIATSLYMLLSAGWMLLLIGRQLGARAYQGLASTSLRALVGSLAAAAPAWLLLQFEFPLNAVAAAIAGLIAYLILMSWLEDGVVRQAIRRSRAG